MTTDPANMSSAERFARIEQLLKIAKGEAEPNRLDRIETLLEETNIALRRTAETQQRTAGTLNRLAERHEGLAETVELLVHEGREILRKLKGGSGN